MGRTTLYLLPNIVAMMTITPKFIHSWSDHALLWGTSFSSIVESFILDYQILLIRWSEYCCTPMMCQLQHWLLWLMGRWCLDASHPEPGGLRVQVSSLRPLRLRLALAGAA